MISVETFAQSTFVFIFYLLTATHINFLKIFKNLFHLKFIFWNNRCNLFQKISEERGCYKIQIQRNLKNATDIFRKWKPWDRNNVALSPGRPQFPVGSTWARIRFVEFVSIKENRSNYNSIKCIYLTPLHRLNFLIHSTINTSCSFSNVNGQQLTSSSGTFSFPFR